MSFLIYYVFLFISGTFFGSFLNVVSDRSIKGEPILFGRSHCDKCKKSLGPKNLVPILSFVFQGGKCSFCGNKLSYYYPISEILAGLIFVLSAVHSNIFVAQRFINIWLFLYVLVILCFYLVIFLTDIKYMLIPDSVINWALVLNLLFLILGSGISLYLFYRVLANDPFGVYLIKVGYLNQNILISATAIGYTILSALVIAAFFKFLVWVTKERGMGSGDIKIGLLIGLFNGFPNNIIAVFMGFVFGAVVSVILILFKKKGLRDTVPFGPFLLTASVFVLIYGDLIWNWYTHLSH